APQPREYAQRCPGPVRAPARPQPDRAAPGPAAAAAPAAPWPAVPGFEVLKELGRGGMGVVYWAWQHSLNRAVALKMILAGAHAGSQELARFRTEAEAVARLQHPNIVQVYEVGRQGEHPYMALEYVDGGSLAQQLTGTPWPARQAGQLVETLARAMHCAHQRGIVHRDLTPGNVLLTADGVPKITDFGLAKILVGGAMQTQTGVILGTPSYIAPEQAAGKTREIGPAVDVYALGAILYELLTGRPPFKAEAALETLLQVQTEERVPPSRLQPKLPRDLTTICLKCLQKEPGKRYGSAEALAEDLRRFLAGEPIRARPVGRAERLWRWCRRNPVVAALTGLAALLLVVIAVGALVGNVILSKQLRRVEEAERDGKVKLWQANLDRAQARRVSRRPGQRFDSLRAIEEALKLPVPPGRSLDE